MKNQSIDDKTLFNHRIMAGVMVGGCAIASAVWFHFRQPEIQSEEQVPQAAQMDAPALDAPVDEDEVSTLARGKPTASTNEIADSQGAALPSEDAPAEEKPTVIVALPHDDVVTNFKEEAEVALEEGQLDVALVALRKHLYRNAPDAGTLIDLAEIASELKQYALAEQALLDASALDPASYDVPTDLALVYLAMKSLEKARFAARQAVRMAPDHADAWNAAGRVAMASSEWQRGEAAFRRAVELDPTNPMLHNNLGLLYIYMRQGDEAVDALETAVELYDVEPPAFVYNNLGLAHELSDQRLEAVQAFSKALSLNPLYVNAQLNLRRLEASIAARGDKAELSMLQDLPPYGDGVLKDEPDDFAMAGNVDDVDAYADDDADFDIDLDADADADADDADEDAQDEVDDRVDFDLELDDEATIRRDAKVGVDSDSDSDKDPDVEVTHVDENDGARLTFEETLDALWGPASAEG
ncbi:MAG: tetratricopeptide repeat protein [Deltaproteobacteria bacterium]|nr:tetratricopeptide repeat protein [Deltaproteobacteria bacterium]